MFILIQAQNEGQKGHPLSALFCLCFALGIGYPSTEQDMSKNVIRK